MAAKTPSDLVLSGLPVTSIKRRVTSFKPKYEDKKNPDKVTNGAETVEVEVKLDFNGCTLAQVLKYAADSLVIQQQTRARTAYSNGDNYDEKTKKYAQPFKKIAADTFKAPVKVSEMSANTRTRDPVESMTKAVAKKSMTKEQIAALIKTL